MTELLYKDLTEKIIKSFLEVYNLLGFGYSKEIYIEALSIEMTRQGLIFERGAFKDILYKGIKIGQYIFDFINDDKVMLHIETAEKVNENIESSLVNNLKSTKYEVGLVLNFGRKPEVRRKIFQNGRKTIIKKGDVLNEARN